MFAVALASAESKLLTAEHLHVMLNHLPIIGRAMAILALRVNLAGQRACKRIREIIDETGTDRLAADMERAANIVPAFYALAALAAAALAVPHKWPRSTRSLAIAAVGCARAGGWIALAGGQIRHPEFRSAPPPNSEAPPHHH